MHKLAEAFAEVEKHDIRVARMTLERPVYTMLAASKDFMFINHYINNPYRMQQNQGNKAIGMLWGASVELGEKSQVFGEKGFFPGHNGMPSNMFDTEFSVGIFDDEWKKTHALRLKLCKLHGNMTIIVRSRAEFFGAIPRNEWNAIETLREMITEKEFKKYMKYGFILVKGQSGRIYQIFRSKWHTKVWENGQLIEEVCVRIKDKKIPPTDNVVAFKNLIEYSEESFKNLGNVYNMRKAA